jgi:photosystem II stability/assembly factor-like uncharacterized protein
MKTKKLKLASFSSIIMVLMIFCIWHFPFGCAPDSEESNNDSINTTACYDTTFMLKTTDGGATWTRLKIKGATRLAKRSSDLAFGRHDYTVNGAPNFDPAFIRFLGDSTVCCNPPNAIRPCIDIDFQSGDIWASTENDLYKTSDYGINWINVPGPYNTETITDFEFGGGGICLLAASDHIYRSVDFGQNWTDSQFLDGFKCIQFINNFGDVYAITEGGVVYISSNSGQTWNAGNFTGYGNFNATYSDDVGGTTYQVIVGGLGLILRSTTGAGTWELVNQPAGAAHLEDVTTNGVNWFAVGGNEIWTGAADATNWTVFTYPDPKLRFRDITFFDQNTGYIVGERFP